MDFYTYFSKVAVLSFQYSIMFSWGCLGGHSVGVFEVFVLYSGRLLGGKYKGNVLEIQHTDETTYLDCALGLFSWVDQGGFTAHVFFSFRSFFDHIFGQSLGPYLPGQAWG